MGRVFLESCQIADTELVDSSGVYHSPATVIEGEISRSDCLISLHRSPDSWPPEQHDHKRQVKAADEGCRALTEVCVQETFG